MNRDFKISLGKYIMVKKTKMRATSMESFAFILENLGERQTLVLKTIKKLQPCSNLMISKELHLPINCVTGRRLELQKVGLVRKYDVRKCPYTKRNVIYWQIPLWMSDALVL